MSTRLTLLLSIFTLLALIYAIGCGGDDLVVGSSTLPPTVTGAVGTQTPVCQPGGLACVFNADCCSGSCNSIIGQCS